MPSPSTERFPKRERVGESLEPVLEQTRAAGFWGAIALPFVYLPLLAVGLDSPTQAALFLGLLGAHLLAVLLGRGYDPR